jgi:hypothetical protein
MDLVIALLIYPGLVLTLALGLLLGPLAGAGLPRPSILAGAGRGAEGLAGLASLLLVALGLGLAPLPLHPAAGRDSVGLLPLVWVLVEAAFLAPLIPAAATRMPLAVRAAAREGQLGIAGRAVVWVAIAAGLWAGSALVDLPGRLLVLASGLLALPAAAGLGPFGPERSLAPDAPEEGLDGTTKALLRFTRRARAGALALLLATSAIPAGLVGAPAALGLALALTLLLGLALRRASRLPRLTLPAALRWCWFRALPLGLAGLAYLLLV